VEERKRVDVEVTRQGDAERRGRFAVSPEQRVEAGPLDGAAKAERSASDDRRVGQCRAHHLAAGDGRQHHDDGDTRRAIPQIAHPLQMIESRYDSLTEVSRSGILRTGPQYTAQ